MKKYIRQLKINDTLSDISDDETETATKNIPDIDFTHPNKYELNDKHFMDGTPNIDTHTPSDATDRGKRYHRRQKQTTRPTNDNLKPETPTRRSLPTPPNTPPFILGNRARQADTARGKDSKSFYPAFKPFLPTSPTPPTTPPHKSSSPPRRPPQPITPDMMKNDDNNQTAPQKLTSTKTTTPSPVIIDNIPSTMTIEEITKELLKHKPSLKITSIKTLRKGGVVIHPEEHRTSICSSNPGRKTL